MIQTIGDEPIEVRAEYLKIAANYALPIYWAEAGYVLHNGTAFVLNTGDRIFGVTAAHVYSAYVNDKDNGLTQICCLSNLEIPLEDRLISIGNGEEIDIATFELNEKEIQSLRDNILSGNQSVWPPQLPKEGEAVVIAGFPGVEIVELAEFRYSFGVSCFNTPISSVSENQFGCAFDRKNWEDIFGNGLPKVNYNLGGVSGAPVLALIISDSNLVTWRLAGVVSQAGASDLLGEIVFVNHARLIDSRGAISECT